MYFLRLLDIVSTDPNALVATLVPPLEGGGELVFADEPQDPLPGRLDRLLGQPAARQQLLHPGEQEIVRWSQIRRIGGMFEHLDLVFGQPLLHYGGSVNWRIVPVEHPALLHQLRPLLLQILQESGEGIHNEGSIHRLPLLDHPGVDEPVGVEEGEDHLLGAARMDPCLDWAWLTLLDPLLAHSFGFRSVEGNHGFVHGHNPVQKGLGLTANGGGELAADPDPLLLLLHRQKLGDPPRRLFYQAQVIMQDGKNRANRHLIGPGKVLYSHPGILVNGGGDSGDEILGPPGLLSIQVALIICIFPVFTLLIMRYIVDL